MSDFLSLQRQVRTKFGVIISICHTLPVIIAGPIIRHVSQHQLTFWLVSNKPYTMQFQLYVEDETNLLADILLSSQQHQQVPIGTDAVVHLISINFSQVLPLNTLLAYNFTFIDDELQQSLTELMPELLYSGQKYPNFVIKSEIKQMLHGSCRKPHFDSGDGLVQVDHVIAASINDAEARPATSSA